MGDGLNGESRVVIGRLPVDVVTTAQALERVERLLAAGAGGAIFTPNVDHVVQAEDSPRLCAAYERVDLSLADGMPILWAALALGQPLPEKISGSDFTPLLIARAAERGWKMYLLGGGPGVASLARDRMLERHPGLKVVGIEAPSIDVDDAPERLAPLVDRIKDTEPHVVLVALGAPKQEIWIDFARDRLKPAVLVGVGASLDFVAGSLPRAPRWMSSIGLEWLYRLGREPRRLWKRYLLRDPQFVVILARALKAQRAGVVRRRVRR
jgi:N-acetylglucosaminyldiphosphoundecaprenol N-acetyl-beta-D-mannosaminyltransferase